MIDDDCNVTYDVRTIKMGGRGIIEDKLKDEKPSLSLNRLVFTVSLSFLRMMVEVGAW